MAAAGVANISEAVRASAEAVGASVEAVGASTIMGAAYGTNELRVRVCYPRR
jgi:hypothetical protein